jgi:hypothetical protein
VCHLPFVRGKVLFLSTAQVAPPNNYKIDTTQNKHTIHNNKHQADKRKQRVGYPVHFMFVVLRVLRFGDDGMMLGLQGLALINGD